MRKDGRSSRFLPPAIEEALKRFEELVRLDKGTDPKFTDKVNCARRKVRRTIAADLHPEAITQLYTFKEGDAAVWMKAEGNGGTYRTNPRNAVNVTVVRDTGKAKVQVHIDQNNHSWIEKDVDTWVLRRCLIPRSVYLSQGMPV